ncbi:MAG TPA: valine--tRNA ligase [Ktedonobacteraceae bacterium]|jgi:valyl-tRNA synthetase|nr:valine--tRNA ligase [Ktedonobacteraceae bacterium]
MSLPKRYTPGTAEPTRQQYWQQHDIYAFSRESTQPLYAIDTPPPTVSGNLHLGHLYSYSHADFMARFWRMNGYNVFYPMGFDDNGLPTERLVEKRLGITALQVGREAFIQKCLEVSEQAEQDYKALWQRLGLSVDWRYSYRTIDELSRRTSQLSFIELYKKGLAYQQEAPSIWCPECRTAIAQAELNDLERQSEFVTLAFRLEDGEILPIATTRPELLPACVAVFVHPDDARYKGLIGSKVRVPLLNFEVPLLADGKANPEKGTGAVMCCTFGDVTDVEWWYKHHLPLKAIIGRDGRINAGPYAGLTIKEARQRIIQDLEANGDVLKREPIRQSVRVHERCDTPVEYIVTRQWFIRVLERKAEWVEAGEQISWHPAHMRARYREWVENLGWDWCISRQRYFGVPFPLWYCAECGEIVLADEANLPVDPSERQPDCACACGSRDFVPEEDVMDTWATSSMTPQIVGRWLSDPELYEKVFPMSLRPQAHEIIRTWAFDTIVKSLYHFGKLPWKTVAISGWGLAGEGMGKISKSRGGGPMAPMQMIEKYSSDAVRYWAASTGFGKDSIISEEKIALGGKLVNKLWNVAKFSERFLAGYHLSQEVPTFTPTDRWLLSRLHRLIRRVTELFRAYDYAAAKSETETFFWRDLADNYLEMAKERLYDEAHPKRDGARYTLYTALLSALKLFAPLLPYITDEIYCALFAAQEGKQSIHISSWPEWNEDFISDEAEAAGETLIEIATAVRRYKSEANLSLGAELELLQLTTAEPQVAQMLEQARADLRSVTRARRIEIGDQSILNAETVNDDAMVKVGIKR